MIKHTHKRIDEKTCPVRDHVRNTKLWVKMTKHVDPVSSSSNRGSTLVHEMNFVFEFTSLFSMINCKSVWLHTERSKQTLSFIVLQLA